jgi:hypothetical protein
VAVVALAGIGWALVGGGDDDGTGDVVTVPPATPSPTTPDNGDNNGDNGRGDGEPPHPCDNPPTSFPGEVKWGEVSDTALAWQKLLVDKNVFEKSEINCDRGYDGDKQKTRVIEERESLGLPAADGLLDQALYDCLVHGGCPDGGGCTLIEVPDVLGFEAGEAEAVLSNVGFVVVWAEESTDAAPPGTVLEQEPEAGTSACKGTPVTLTVAALPTPEPTRDL